MYEFFGRRTNFRNVTFIKVKQVNFALEQAMKAQMGSRDIAVLFL